MMPNSIEKSVNFQSHKKQKTVHRRSFYLWPKEEPQWKQLAACSLYYYCYSNRLMFIGTDWPVVIFSAVSNPHKIPLHCAARYKTRYLKTATTRVIVCLDDWNIHHTSGSFSHKITIKPNWVSLFLPTWGIYLILRLKVRTGPNLFGRKPLRR